MPRLISLLPHSIQLGTAPIFAALTWLVIAPAVSQAEDESRTRIKAKHVHTVDGQVFSPGEVLVVDGKIAFVGNSIELSLPAEEVEVDTLIPGLVNASTNYGLSGGEAEVSREVTPDFNTLSAVDWRSREFQEALDQGVTTAQVLPATQSVFAGFACVVKTAGPEASRVLNARQGVVLAMSSDPTSGNRSRSRPDSIYVRQPTNRMGVVWIIRNALHQSGQTTPVGLDPDTQVVLQGITSGQYPVLNVSRADFDIRSGLDLGTDFGYLPVVYGGDEVYRMLEEFKQSGASLVYTAMTAGSTNRALRGDEGTELRWNVPGKLQEAEIPFCLAGDQLLDQAQFAVRFGLTPQQALQAVTLSAAKILNLDDEIGSITVGKEADLVALNGNPLHPTSAVTWTMVGGKIFGNDESN